MRRVMVSEYKKLGEDTFYTLVEKGEAVFHEFGVDFEELSDGNVTYSTAIVEYADGTVSNVAVDRIRFI